MDLFLLLFLLVFLWKFKIEKNFNEEYLSLKTCRAWKGIFAFVVIFHHASHKISNGFLFKDFMSVGFLAVAVFFFFSGYGLQKKYITDINYENSFLKKRIPTILFPYIIMTFVYWGANAVGNEVYSLKDIFVMTLNGEPIVMNSWYIINILLCYLLFYLFMKICKQNYKFMILGMGLACVAMLFLYKSRRFGIWWYNSTQLLVVGMAWATYENKILNFIKKYYYIILPIITISFILCFTMIYTSEGKNNIPMQLLSSTLFTIGILFISLKVKIGNAVLNFLGKISFEIYLLHGLIMAGLRNNLIYIKNDLLWFSLVLVLSIVSAFIFHKICEFFLVKYKKLIA